MTGSQEGAVRELLERAPVLEDALCGLGDYEPDLVFAFSARKIREGAKRRDGTKVERDPDGGACVWPSVRDAEEAMRFYIPDSGVFSLSLERAKRMAKDTGRTSLVLVDGECEPIRRWTL